MNEEMKELLALAIAQTTALKNAGAEVGKRLNEGVSLVAAYAIVEQYWTGREASRIKQGLTSVFPVQNGGYLLNATLKGQLGAALNFEAAEAFFKDGVTQLIAAIEAKFQGINRASLNDPDALASFTEFSKQPGRFAEYLADPWFEGSRELLEGTTTLWGGIPDRSRSSDSGDFLLTEDYSGALKDVQKSTLRHFDKGADGMFVRTLGNVENFCENILVCLLVCKLFAEYLEGPDPMATKTAE